MPSPVELRPTATPLSDAERAQRMQKLGFGRVFSEHMVVARYADGAWQRAVLQPYGPITLDPAASVLHYGQAIFEGFKAYRQKQGGIATFRPEANAARFARSAERMAMPPVPTELFVAAADALIRQDVAWVPGSTGESYYLRPLMIATEAALGVRPAREYEFILFGSPSGSYFTHGVKPVSVWISEDYVRAAPGGTGAAKCAGNYAASLVGYRDAVEKGCDQVVWIDAVERKYVEEMGGMNIFFVYQAGERTTLVTPKLTGTLLPGVTRDSLLALAGDLGYAVEERLVSVEEWQRDARSTSKEGRMTEAFACGTAAVITPIGSVKSRGGEWLMGDGSPGPVQDRLRATLLGIQHGELPDTRHWMHEVP